MTAYVQRATNYVVCFFVGLTITFHNYIINLANCHLGGMMIKIAMVEDNDADARVLSAHIKNYFSSKNEEYTLKRFRNAESVLELVHSFDILFLDIELEGMNGMDAAREIRKFDEKIVLIFVSNMRQYVINGYEVQALNYILKPIQYAGFLLTIERALTIVKRREDSFITVRKKDAVYQINRDDILYIDVVRHDIVIHGTQESYFLYGTLSQYEKMLKPYGFVCCSSNTLINLRYVKQVVDGKVIVGKEEFTISRRMKKDFIDALTIFYGEKL